MSDANYVNDPHRIRNIDGLEWLFRHNPHEVKRTTCDYCGLSARRTLEPTRKWFVEHACKDETTGLVTDGRKYAPVLTEAEARTLEAIEQDTRTIELQMRGTYRRARRVKPGWHRSHRVDEVAARRTVKGVGMEHSSATLVRHEHHHVHEVRLTIVREQPNDVETTETLPDNVIRFPVERREAA